jgi:NADH:ubiquinone oxidoreductase subunit E
MTHAHSIIICLGSSCSSRGNAKHLATIREFLAHTGLEDSVEISGSLCNGHCKKGPNIMIDGKPYYGIDTGSLVDILTHTLKPKRED